MYDSLHIENFRCFKNLDLDDLAKYNFIVGKNNIGKTTLIETLRLLDEASTSSYTIRAGAYFSEYFNNDSWPILLSGRSPFLGERQLTMKFLKHGGMVGIVKMLPGSLGIWYKDEYGAEFPTGLNPPVDMGGKVTPQQKELEQLDGDVFRAKVVGYISQLNKSEMIEVLRLIEPRIQELSIDQVRGRPLVYATLSNGKKVPLPSMGDGINHLLMTLAVLFEENTTCTDCKHSKKSHDSGRRCIMVKCNCATYSAPDVNVILWDELEHSYYPGFLEDLWQIIISSEVGRNRQFFITTHDHNLLRRLDYASGEYRVIKLFRNADDGVSATVERRYI